jgi:hypothetical protein
VARSWVRRWEPCGSTIAAEGCQDTKCRGRADASEISVFAAVAVSVQGGDVGAVDEAVDHGGGDGVLTAR